jgi:hypothetical protein
LPKEILGSLQNEEDLENVLQKMEKEIKEPSTVENDKENLINENTEGSEETEDIKCVICLKKCSENPSLCTDCLNPVHVTCAIEVFNEDVDGMNENRCCVLCHRKKSIANERNKAKDGLCQQANRMKMISDKEYLSVAIGSTVRVNVPDVDRGRGDPRSVLAIVLNVTEHNFYKLGTRNGVIKQLYARSQFSLCEEKLISVEEVPSIEVSLRTVATAQSTGTGQGFSKCTCIKK